MGSTRAAAAVALTLATAGTALGQIGITVVADAPTDFDAILSGSINAGGNVAFAALPTGTTNPTIYLALSPDYIPVMQTAGTNPVLNDDQELVYVTNDNTAIFQFMDIELVADAGDFAGALAVNAGANPDVAFWSWTNGTQTIFRFPQPVATVPADLGALGAPAITDVQAGEAFGDIMYVRSLHSGNSSSLQLVHHDALDFSTNTIRSGINDAAQGLSAIISNPSVNSAGTTVTVFAQSNDPADPAIAGIYAFPPTPGVWGAPLVDLSAPALTPAVNTQPFINDLGDIAFTTLASGAQAILVKPDGAPVVTMVTAGDTFDIGGTNFTIVDNTLEAIGISGCQQILFTAQVTDGAAQNPDIRNVLAVATNTVVCPSFDLDGDGVVGINDFLILLGMWGTSPPGPPDFNGDGSVGIDDLLALLGNWGTTS